MTEQQAKVAGRPVVHIHVSTVEAMRRRALALFGENQQEVESEMGPPRPDWDTYSKLEEAGLLIPLLATSRYEVASDGLDLPVGYAINIVGQHHNYRHIRMLTNVTIFVSAECRGSDLAVRLVRESIERGKNAGCSWAMFHSKSGHRFKALLSRLGMSPIEDIWGKEI